MTSESALKNYYDPWRATELTEAEAAGVAAIRVGDRFDRLTVAGPAEEGRFPVRCDCGKEITARGIHLFSGMAISCGCTRCRVCKFPPPTPTSPHRVHKCRLVGWQYSCC